MMIKIHHRLPYRTLQGFSESLIKHLPYAIPHYARICKRARKLKLPKLSSKNPLLLLSMPLESRFLVKENGKLKSMKNRKDVNGSRFMKTVLIVRQARDRSNQNKSSQKASKN